jgi:hypothetical protein
MLPCAAFAPRASVRLSFLIAFLDAFLHAFLDVFALWCGVAVGAPDGRLLRLRCHYGMAAAHACT